LSDNLPPTQRDNAKGIVQGIANTVDQHINSNNAQTAQQIEANWQRHNAALNALAPEIAKYQSERHVPGVGDSSIPLQGDDRKRILGINNFQNLLNEAEGLNKEMGLTGRLSPSKQARALQIKNDLVSSYNDVKGLTRFTGNEEALYDKIVPDVGNISGTITGSTKAGLERLKTSVQQKKDLEYQQLGIQNPDNQQTTQPSSGTSGTIERKTKDGRIAIFDSNKKFLNYK
jgi:hypothetical protein